MIFLFIGLTIGLMMGITGAGGAILSIPLFQIAKGMSLREATVLSLITVIFGTAVNLLPRIREVSWRIVLVFTASGAAANYLAHPFKKMMPEIVITSLLLLIGIYSIVSVLYPKADKEMTKDPHIIVITTIGMILGLVTTFTGLGGGVLLIPILLGVFGMTYEKAIPTSLASILFISLSSLVIQWKTASSLISGMEIIFIGVGATLAYLVLKKILSSLTDEKVAVLRKTIFITVTVVSLTIVIFKTV